MDSGRTRTPRRMWIGLVTTTAAAALTLLLCVTGLPDALVVPVLVVLLSVMTGGLVADVLVRRDWRRTVRAQRRWLNGLPTDLPDYRGSVEERERVLFGWESRWWRPLGTLFLVALSAALVPFNLLLPLAPDAPVDQLVAGWVTATLVLTAVLVVRTVHAARLDSTGLVFPTPRPASVESSAAEPTRSAAAIAREESIAKYLVVEEEVAPEIQLARELDRLTSLLNDPGVPRPYLPVPAGWMPTAEAEATPEEPVAEAGPEDEAGPEAETGPEAEEPTVERPVVEDRAADEPADADESGESDRPSSEGELDKLAKWFRAA
ncbi:hypothetical protein [Mumia sp.]|uniref:hypothetical protein n=1 Tax=Mumia sp. TaxID=1965300 RepID=UPI00262FD532|nr:hypothetical protein [Mumia sp.]MDD9349106.1 hypothetical protein [Mumia sp.]